MAKKGLTLVEVMVSVAILSILAMTLMPMYFSSITLNRLSYERGVASAAAESIIQELRSEAFDDFEDAVKRFDADSSNDPDGASTCNWQFRHKVGENWVDEGTFKGNTFSVLAPNGSLELEPLEINGAKQPQGEVIMADQAGRFSELPNEVLYGRDLQNGVSVGVDMNFNGTTTDDPAYTKDLNLDNDATDSNVNVGDLLIIPVIVRISWMSNGLPVHLRVKTFITKNQ